MKTKKCKKERGIREEVKEKKKVGKYKLMLTL